MSIMLLSLAFSSWAGVRDYTKKVYDANKDFFGVFVYSIVQDADGFLWIGSDDGLYRFDGHTMINLNKRDSTMNTLVTASTVTNDGHLLMGYYNGGMSIVEHSKYRKLIPEDSLDNKINRILETDSGDVWVLTQNLGFARIHEGLPVFYHEEHFDHIIAKDMAIHGDELYVATNSGLLMFGLVENEEPHFLGIMSGTENVDILSVISYQDQLWLGTSDGVKTVDVTVAPADQTSVDWDYMQHYQITALAFDQLGDLWIGTRNNGLIEVETPLTSPAFTRFHEGNGFESDQISKIYVDAENEVWVGTFGDGLVQLNRANFHHYALRKPFKINSISAISSYQESDLLLATNRGLIHAFKPFRSDSLNFEKLDLLEGIFITSLFRQGEKLWIGTQQDGMYVLKNKSLAHVEIPDLDININQQIRHITEDRAGNLWISVAGNGVLKFSPQMELLEHFNTRNGFYHNEIYYIYPDKKGNVWFAAHGAGLAIYDATGAFQLLSRDGFFDAHDINSIKSDKDGVIWIATSGQGLYSYDGDEFVRYDYKKGLLSDFCNSIIFDRNDNVWIAHRMGLSLIQKEYGIIRVFNHPEELGETETIINSNHMDEQGNVWVGNPYGVTKVILPHIIHQIKNRNTHIVDMRFYYEPVDLLTYTDQKKLDNILPQEMEFPHDQNHITFDYVAINLKDPEAMFYQYKLDGYEKEWSPITSNINATYTNLDPGTYTFEVKESDHPDYWDNQYASITFTIDDPFWEKWWFYIAQIVFIGGIVVATYTSMGRVDNPLAGRLMVYVSLFMLFEYIHTEFEPYLDDFAGEVPIFQVVINLILALILFPAEGFVLGLFKKRRLKAQQRTIQKQIIKEHDEAHTSSHSSNSGVGTDSGDPAQ